MPRYIIPALLVLVSMAANVMALTLTADGKSDYVIVVAADAIAPEVTSARELQTHLQLVTGARLRIRSESEAGKSVRQIVIGPTDRFKAAFPRIDIASLKHDGIVIQTAGDTLFLAGGRPRGTLYAVYSFLEDTVGCRWWGSRPDETFMPVKRTLTIPALATVYVPELRYREAFYRGAMEGVYAARSKCNGNFEGVTPAYGDHYRILGWCHTFYPLLPPEKYFAPHPEWYSEIGGKRVGEGAQLCLTNEDMRREFTRNALEWLRRDPQAGMISIAQNDCGGPCQCANCRKVVAEEGAESGMLLRFVNAVAEEIEKEFPDTLVETLAYQYTRSAPKVTKPRGNVVVRLCSIECSFSQPLATGKQNEKFKADIEAWSAIAPQLYIWDYVTDFANYIIPHPNLRVLAPNIRFFVKNKCIGLFEQGDSSCSCSDFPELRGWLLAHLMWDPSRDDKALIVEFLHGYYGPAAEPIQRYIDLIHDAVERSGAYLTCWASDTAGWMTPDTINQATKLWDDAQQRVKDDVLLSARVRRGRLPLDHTWLQRYAGLKRLAQLTKQPFMGPADPQAACEDFIRTAQSFDVRNYSEGGGFASHEPLLRSRFPAPGKAAPPPKEAAGLAAEDWVDIQQGEMSLAGAGNWVNLVDDPKASDGKAACMTTNHNQWATQYPIPGDLTALGKWHCYVVARCDAKVKTGPAFQIGLYDNQAAADVAGITETLENAGDGEYRTYDLGVHDLVGGMYFWLAPMSNPDAVGGVYTDRIFLVREK